MYRVLSIIAIVAATFGCAVTVSDGGSTPPIMREEQDASPTPDTATTDAAVNETSVMERDTSTDAVSDTGMMTDSGLSPLIVTLSTTTPAGRSVPRNATGVFAAAFDLTSTGEAVPIRLLRFRRIGVGAPREIGNVYQYGVTTGSRANTPFRYSLGRAVNATSNEFTMPFGTSVRAGATATELIYLDFDLASAMVGSQHAIELIGVVIEDGSPDGLLLPVTAVRSHALTISADYASRLDVQRGPPIEYLGMGVAHTAIASFRLRAGYHNLGVVHLSFYQAGSVMTSTEISDLELWRGSERIPISEWTIPLNGYLVLSPSAPIFLRANTTSDFIIRGRVTSALGKTIRIYAEYPTDVQAVDLTLNTPAATCIASTATGGCDGPNQGSFDGTDGNMSEAMIMP